MVYQWPGLVENLAKKEEYGPVPLWAVLATLLCWDMMGKAERNPELGISVKLAKCYKQVCFVWAKDFISFYDNLRFNHLKDGVCDRFANIPFDDNLFDHLASFEKYFRLEASHTWNIRQFGIMKLEIIPPTLNQIKDDTNMLSESRIYSYYRPTGFRKYELKQGVFRLYEMKSHCSYMIAKVKFDIVDIRNNIILLNEQKLILNNQKHEMNSNAMQKIIKFLANKRSLYTSILGTDGMITIDKWFAGLPGTVKGIVDIIEHSDTLAELFNNQTQGTKRRKKFIKRKRHVPYSMRKEEVIPVSKGKKNKKEDKRKKKEDEKEKKQEDSDSEEEEDKVPEIELTFTPGDLSTEEIARLRGMCNDIPDRVDELYQMKLSVDRSNDIKIKDVNTSTKALHAKVRELRNILSKMQSLYKRNEEDTYSQYKEELTYYFPSYRNAIITGFCHMMTTQRMYEDLLIGKCKGKHEDLFCSDKPPKPPKPQKPSSNVFYVTFPPNEATTNDKMFDLLEKEPTVEEQDKRDLIFFSLLLTKDTTEAEANKIYDILTTWCFNQSVLQISNNNMVNEEVFMNHYVSLTDEGKAKLRADIRTLWEHDPDSISDDKQLGLTLYTKSEDVGTPKDELILPKILKP